MAIIEVQLMHRRSRGVRQNFHGKNERGRVWSRISVPEKTADRRSAPNEAEQRTERLIRETVNFLTLTANSRSYWLATTRQCIDINPRDSARHYLIIERGQTALQAKKIEAAAWERLNGSLHRTA